MVWVGPHHRPGPDRLPNTYWHRGKKKTTKKKKKKRKKQARKISRRQLMGLGRAPPQPAPRPPAHHLLAQREEEVEGEKGEEDKCGDEVYVESALIH